MTLDLTTVNDLATVFCLISGLFFLFVAGFGLLRMPDFYHRMHAASKGVTLGIVGLLLAALIYMPTHMEVSAVLIVTKVLLAILFQFIANPVGAHLLSKAAHLDGVAQWYRTRADDLQTDRASIEH